MWRRFEPLNSASRSRSWTEILGRRLPQRRLYPVQGAAAQRGTGSHLHKDAAKFGISVDVTFDYGAAYKRSRDVADGRVKGVHFLMRKNKIDEYDGWGTFADPHTISIALSDGSTETVTFDHAIVATGAKARLLPGTSLSDRVVTFEEQILSDRLPASIIIAGAGAIGVEFAYVRTTTASR